uniref:Uncharacterized protein n=1 Tax=Oryza sativa subsp. japonica TaxID=39947 RepID=Q652R1_ORYSJ|nr:hypothetical protein [Oryza sativa Japonica Group]BAD54159.1 hypothetical protein [Oryza sativa Japonica Group]
MTTTTTTTGASGRATDAIRGKRHGMRDRRKRRRVPADEAGGRNALAGQIDGLACTCMPASTRRH